MRRHTWIVFCLGFSLTWSTVPAAAHAQGSAVVRLGEWLRGVTGGKRAASEMVTCLTASDPLSAAVLEDLTHSATSGELRLLERGVDTRPGSPSLSGLRASGDTLTGLIDEARTLTQRIEQTDVKLTVDGTIELDVLGLPDTDTLELAIESQRFLQHVKNYKGSLGLALPERTQLDKVPTVDERVADIERQIRFLETRNDPVPSDLQAVLDLDHATLEGQPQRAADLADQFRVLKPWVGSDAFLEQLGLEAQTVRSLAASVDPSIDQLYTGRNAKLEEWYYGEPSDASFQTVSLRDKIEQDHAPDKAGNWWIRSFQTNPATKESYATITAETSRSPLRSLYGEGSYRHPMWVRGGGRAFYDGPNNPEPFLEEIRFALNYDAQGRARSIELLVWRDGHWNPFFFVRRAGRWLPAKNFVDVQLDEAGRIVGTPQKGKPIEESCIQCHAIAPGSNVLSPLPFFLKTAADLEAVGYRDKRLIERLLESGRSVREGRPVSGEGGHRFGDRP